MKPRDAVNALCALLAMTTVASAQGRTHRVGPGIDGDAIAEAIRNAQPGDTVLLAPGSYEGAIWVDHSGAPGRPITVRGDGALGAVVLHGGGETLNIGDGAHDLVFESLEVRDSGDNLVHVQGGAHDIVLRRLRVHDAGDDGDGIKVNQAHDITIRQVECFHPGRRPDRPDGNPAQECIDLVDVQRARIADCWLHDGGNMLVFAKGGSSDVVLERNVIEGQGPDAIDPCVGLGGATDRELLRGRQYEGEDLVFRNNVVARCHAGGVGVYDARRVSIVNNTLLDDGPDVVQFRAGNSPLEISRDVHVIDNVFVDDGGAMRSPLVLLSHRVDALEVRNNLYWNGARPVPATGLSDPHHERDAVIADPRFAASLAPGAPSPAAVQQALVPRAGAIDRGVTLRGPGAVADDLLGHRRPGGRAIDLGAIESDATTRADDTAATPWPSTIPNVDPVLPTVVPHGTALHPGARGSVRRATLGLGALALGAIGVLVGRRVRRAH